MSDRKQIPKLVDKLNHPDMPTRRQYMDRLVELGGEAVPVLVANLRLVDADVRPTLVRVLGEIGDDEALLPLMRYVFDTAGEPGEGDARGLGMQAIMKIAEPRHADRLFEFLVDMKDDDDTFVRGYVIEAFGRLGDPRGKPFVKDAVDDNDQFVRECADRAWKALEESDTEPLKSSMSGRDLLAKIRTATGSELDYYMNELAARDNAFELAAKLVREDKRETMRGLRTLQKLDDPRARDLVRRQFASTESDAARAVCLRILASHLAGDATPEEVDIIREGLDDRDQFVSLAAVRAAGASGDYDLTMSALKAARSNDETRAVTAAKGLSEGLNPDLIRLVPDIIDTLEAVHRYRLGAGGSDIVRAEAYLLRGLDAIVDAESMGVSDAHQAALTSLEGASDLKPIVVTSLNLLLDTLPDDGLPEDRRWTDARVQPLLALLKHSDDSIAGRALKVVQRAVSPDAPGLSEHLSRLIYSDPDQLVDPIIPFLEEIGDQKCRDLLGELSSHTDPEVADEAEAALRRLRNPGSTLDVTYE